MMHNDACNPGLNGKLQDEIVARIGQERAPEIEDGVRFRDATDEVKDVVNVRDGSQARPCSSGQACTSCGNAPCERPRGFPIRGATHSGAWFSIEAVSS